MKQKQLTVTNKKIQRNKRIFKISIGILLIAVFMFFTSMSIKYMYQTQITQLSNQSQSQMMGYVIKTYHNKLMVIDGGTTDDTQNLINVINQNGGKVDYWFITHPHKDHASCIIDIIQNTDIPIEHIYVSLNSKQWYEQNEPERSEEAENLHNVLQNDKVKDKVIEPKINDIIDIDNIQCEILGVKNPEITTNAINNSSMIFRLIINDKKVLFLGDTGTESSKKLMETQPHEKLKADIVQMAHHGQSGATEELYKIINPKICLWPTPDWLWTNDSGEGEDTGNWKTKETRKWMENLNVEKNIIEKDGDKTITIW